MSRRFSKQYQALGLDPATEDMLPRQKGEVIYSAACLKLKIDPSAMPDVSGVREKYQAPQTGFHKLMVVRDAITNDREADWNDSNEYKYGGWFWMDDPGFRFCGTRCDDSYSVAAGGSRLCTFSDRDEEFFLKECVAFWADFYGGKLPS